jgi:hypothetical protein
MYIGFIEFISFKRFPQFDTYLACSSVAQLCEKSGTETVTWLSSFSVNKLAIAWYLVTSLMLTITWDSTENCSPGSVVARCTVSLTVISLSLYVKQQSILTSKSFVRFFGWFPANGVRPLPLECHGQVIIDKVEGFAERIELKVWDVCHVTAGSSQQLYVSSCARRLKWKHREYMLYSLWWKCFFLSFLFSVIASDDDQLSVAIAMWSFTALIESRGQWRWPVAVGKVPFICDLEFRLFHG